MLEQAQRGGAMGGMPPMVPGPNGQMMPANPFQHMYQGPQQAYQDPWEYLKKAGETMAGMREQMPWMFGPPEEEEEEEEEEYEPASMQEMMMMRFFKEDERRYDAEQQRKNGANGQRPAPGPPPAPNAPRLIRAEPVEHSNATTQGATPPATPAAPPSPEAARAEPPPLTRDNLIAQLNALPTEQRAHLMVGVVNSMSTDEELGRAVARIVQAEGGE